MSLHGRFQRLTISVAIGGIADIAGNAAGSTGTRMTHERHSANRYSMTPSASSTNDCEIVTPRDLAVLRLTINSNLVGCSIGRSVVFSPLQSGPHNPRPLHECIQAWPVRKQTTGLYVFAKSKHRYHSVSQSKFSETPAVGIKNWRCKNEQRAAIFRRRLCQRLLIVTRLARTRPRQGAARATWRSWALPPIGGPTTGPRKR